MLKKMLKEMTKETFAEIYYVDEGILRSKKTNKIVPARFELRLEDDEGNKVRKAFSSSKVIELLTGKKKERKAKPNKYLPGVSKTRTGYKSEIVVNGSKTYLGLFCTPEEAHEHYIYYKEHGVKKERARKLKIKNTKNTQSTGGIVEKAGKEEKVLCNTLTAEDRFALSRFRVKEGELYRATGIKVLKDTVRINGRYFSVQFILDNWNVEQAKRTEEKKGRKEERVQRDYLYRHYNLDQETMLEIFDYDADTGVITSKVNRGRVLQGEVLGTIHTDRYGKSYRRIHLNAKSYSAHRIIFLMVYGYLPDQVDHINGDGTDNRLVNLREVDQAENNKNRRKQDNNISGVTGVSWAKDKKKWRAHAGEDGKNKHLGYFDLFEDAVAARKEAEEVLGYHENHGTDRPL